MRGAEADEQDVVVGSRLWAECENERLGLILEEEAVSHMYRATVDRGSLKLSWDQEKGKDLLFL